jgi:purine nucleosidase
MSRKFVIDTDTASDDAVAMIMALRHPDVEVLGVTVVSGNVPVEQGARNAVFTVELCEAEVPVYVGAQRPLVREPAHAYWFHGRDGLGDVGYEPRGAPAEGSAVDFLVETIHANPGLTLVTLGPLTNIAIVLAGAPELATQVERCIVMGGAACTVGNVTPAAEFNIWADPDAAREVFRSGLPIEMVGWELCRGEATLDDEDRTYVRGFGTPFSDFALDCNRTALIASKRQSGEPGLDLPDPVAMAVALDPKVALRTSRCYVDVETTSDLTRGMTVVDELDVTHDERNLEVWRALRKGPPNVRVCWEIDVMAWKESLYRSLR